MQKKYKTTKWRPTPRTPSPHSGTHQGQHSSPPALQVLQLPDLECGNTYISFNSKEQRHRMKSTHKKQYEQKN